MSFRQTLFQELVKTLIDQIGKLRLDQSDDELVQTLVAHGVLTTRSSMGPDLEADEAKADQFPGDRSDSATNPCLESESAVGASLCCTTSAEAGIPATGRSGCKSLEDRFQFNPWKFDFHFE